jgi:hypothetical protein
LGLVQGQCRDSDGDRHRLWVPVDHRAVAGSQHCAKASNSYQVQKDAREFLSGILGDSAFRNVLAGNSAYDSHSLENLWLMLNFWRSIHRQEVAGGLLQEYVNSVHEDFCEFMKRPIVEEGWNKLHAEMRIGEGHVQMRKAWCSGS